MPESPPPADASPAPADTVPADTVPAAPAWSVYILRCADGSLYTGVTNDLERRIGQHNTGRGARYTRGRGPVTLAFSEPQPSHGAALQRELAIKKLSRPEKESLIRSAKGSARTRSAG